MSSNRALNAERSEPNEVCGVTDEASLGLAGDWRGHRKIHVLAPTRLEYWAARTKIHREKVIHTGVGLREWTGVPSHPVLFVGLAGGLDQCVQSGQVLIPDAMALEDGRTFASDRELLAAMKRAARELGHEAVGGVILTSSRMVAPNTTKDSLNRAYVAADMEAGLLAGLGVSVASVRVILDSSDRTISDQWLEPTRALRHPHLWPELLWLASTAPRYALIAGGVAARGLRLWRGSAG